MSSLFSELKRRNVLRIAALYLVSAWLIAQVTDVLIGLANLPPTVGRTVLIILAIGFPVALGLAWVFEWTAVGIRREALAEGEAAIAHTPRRGLDYVILSLLSVALLYFAATHDWGETPQVTGVSIAVLPFDNRSSQADDLYFTDGIHDDLLTQLAKISSLVVISRTSVMRYRDTEMSIPEIAAELGVANILEGGIQRAGDRVRINLQLIEAATDRHLWADTYDRKLSAENVFAIQSEIATSIANILHATLLPEEVERINTIPTQNLDAYDAYLLGRRRYAMRRLDALIEAKTYFSQAIEFDPGFALAYTGLADTLVLYAEYAQGQIGNRDQVLADAERAARKALELDPNLGEAHTSIGLVVRARGEPAEKYADYLARGVELAPGSADARKWYSNYLSDVDRKEEALVQLRKAVELDPMSAIVRVNLGNTLESMGQLQEARAAYRKALDIDPGFMPALFSLMDSSTVEEGLRIFSQVHPERTPDPWNLLFFVTGYLALGDDERAAQWLHYIERLAPETTPALIARLNISLFRKQWDDALRIANQMIPIESPVMPVPTRVLSLNDIRQGNAGAARARYEQKYPQLLDDNPKVTSDFPAAIDIALVLATLGESESASLLLDRSLESIGESGALELYANGIYLARIHAIKGNKEEALRLLRATIDSGWYFQWWFFMPEDAALDSIRDDPRFQAVQNEMAAGMARQLANVRKLEASGEIALPPE
ncbi:MAG TPA: tetratricopeptide repeat protein [Woeseiaceae bacterium]|nr:tetratricopeptide repeat protein [Woeseiaceae bacterium]